MIQLIQTNMANKDQYLLHSSDQIQRNRIKEKRMIVSISKAGKSGLFFISAVRLILVSMKSDGGKISAYLSHTNEMNKQAKTRKLSPGCQENSSGGVPLYEFQ